MTTRPTTGRPTPPRLGPPLGIPNSHHTIIRDHIITGTPVQLANIMANHRAAGTFITAGLPRPVNADRFQMVIRLRELAPAYSTTRVSSVGEYARTYTSPTRRWTRIAVIATTVAGGVAGLLAAAAYLIGQLVELLATPAALVLGVLAAIVAYRASRRDRGNRHCPGC